MCSLVCDGRKQRMDGVLLFVCRKYTNFRLKHVTEHSGFFVLAKLSAARRTGGTRERNEAKTD